MPVAFVTGNFYNNVTIIDVTNPVAPVYAGRASSIAAPWYLHTATRVFVTELSLPTVQTLPATGVT